ncbi:DUF456 domain-containing protein [Arthrobacter frigidicola]|nr:DUF456 domain-containing protein [Arthrobacter frigidicola]
MDFQVLMTVVSGLLIAVGTAGVVVPVLPGSVLIVGSLLLWAFAVESAVGWVVFGLGSLFAVAGLLSGLVLTGRTLKRQRIPGRSVTIGLIIGVVGMFAVPVVGLFLGFALGLFASEYQRQRNARSALSSSLQALKATGLGILAELGFAFAAGTTWILGVWVHFA